MASSGESGSESDSWSRSDSDSDSPSDLGASTGKPSSAAEGGAGTSQSPSKRARKGGDDALVHIGEDLVVTQSELLDKMKELKRGFVKASRTGRIGKTPDDRKIFELSRALWGGGGGVPTSPKKKGGHAAGPSKLPEGEPEETDWASMSSLLKVYGMKVEEELLRGGMKMVDSSKVEEMKTRLRAFRVAEMQMATDKMTLQHDVTKLFLDGYLAARKRL